MKEVATPNRVKSTGRGGTPPCRNTHSFASTEVTFPSAHNTLCMGTRAACHSPGFNIPLSNFLAIVNNHRPSYQHHQQKTLTLLDDVMVKNTTTAEIMARDSCDQKEIQAIRLQKMVHAPQVK